MATATKTTAGYSTAAIEDVTGHNGTTVSNIVVFHSDEKLKNMDVDDFWLDEISPSELKEYREMLMNLGFYPDKVQINTLTMIAEDYASLEKSASDLYNLIRDMLLNPKVAAGRKLPLIYVIDSILKNAKGQYIPLIESTACEWVDATYKMMEHREEERGKLRRVINTWRDFNIFQRESIDLMSKVFDEAGASAKAKVDSDSVLLDVTPSVKKQMQLLLNSLHEGMDELQKISLERLAQINPKLLEQIRQEAIDLVSRNADAASTGKVATSAGSCVCTETRSRQEIERSLEWANIEYFNFDQGKELVSSLQSLVLEGTVFVTPPSSGTDNNDLMELLIAASAASKYLSQMMQKTFTSGLNGASSRKRQSAALSQQKPLYPSFMQSSAGFYGKSDAQRYVSKDNFTNEGLKERNSWAIGSLYDQGLPFVSSSDGRRFATQLEISKHIDALFRKSQAGKVIERAEERGWFCQERDWSGSPRSDAIDAKEHQSVTQASADSDASLFHIADESRSKCAICGMLFKMIFDNDHGEWMYTDCREVEVLNDDAAEEESDLMLVHHSCWRKVGSPDQLTKDQIL